MPEFKAFAKIPRLRRKIIVTEKIDGTNACVVVDEDGAVSAQSRSRLITPTNDNYGFARWVADHSDELRTLGPGHHFGEWWGAGIQRRYEQQMKHFSLFNVGRWSGVRPACCLVVPVIGAYDDFSGADVALAELKRNGSKAAPGYMNPEGIICYHAASGYLFKMTIEKDDEPKGHNANI
jgi:RNA ligase